MGSEAAHWNKQLDDERQVKLALEAIFFCWGSLKYSPFEDPHVLLMPRCGCSGNSTIIGTYQRIMENLKLGDKGLPVYLKFMLKRLPNGKFAVWHGMADERLAEVGAHLWATAHSLVAEGG